MKVGLVLGAGGVMGGAWLTGGLHALATETGWDPASADYVVGTSAGSMIGGLLASGVPPWFMVAHSAGETFDGLTDAAGEPQDAASRSGGAEFRLELWPPPVVPGSWQLIARNVLRPSRHQATAIIGGWLPRGIVSNQPLRETVRRVTPSGWADHPNLWIVACDYATGERVAFGRADAPRADLADAVAASCAIPGFYKPVTIAGRRYVDGGLWSTSNLDILLGEHCDLVVCLNPTSSLHPPHAWNPAERVAASFRTISGRRLGSETKKLREHGTDVVLIQPTTEDHRAMGPNLMATRNRQQVIETAVETVTQQLRERHVRKLVAGLPAGEEHMVRRPPGPPSTWPDTLPGRRRGGQVGGAYEEAV
jgi:NTE family protein